MSTTTPNGSSRASTRSPFSLVLDDLQATIQAQLDQLDASRAEMVNNLALLDEERNRCKRILRAAEPVSAKQPKKAVVKRAQPGKPVLDQIQYGIQVLADRGVEEFTVKMVFEAAGGKGKPAWHKAFQLLRDAEYLGKAGMQPRSIDGGKPSQLWRVIDPEGLERVRVNG